MAKSRGSSLISVVAVTVTVIIIAVSTCMGGCSRRGSQKPITPPTKIGVSLAGVGGTAELVQRTLMPRQQQDRVQLIVKDAKGDSSQQERDVGELVKSEIKALIIEPVDPKQGSTVLREALNRQLPIVAIGRLPDGVPVQGYVGADPRRIGELQGQFLQKVRRGEAKAPAPTMLGAAGGGGGGGAGAAGGGQGGGAAGGSPGGGAGGGGAGGGGAGGGGAGQAAGPMRTLALTSPRVLFISRGNAQPETSLMLSGLRLAVGNQLQVITDQVPAGLSPDATVFSLLKKHLPLGAVLAADDQIASSLSQALVANNLAGKVICVGVGGGKDAASALNQGSQQAEIDTQPDVALQTAYEAARELAQRSNWSYNQQLAAGDYDVPAKIVPARLVQPENVYLIQQRHAAAPGQAGGQGGGGGGGGQGGGQGGGGSGGGSQGGQGGGGEGQSGQTGGGQGGPKPRNLVQIKTKDGKTFTMEVEGEIQSVQIKPQLPGPGAAPGAQGGGQSGAGGGGQGGGDGGSGQSGEGGGS